MLTQFLFRSKNDMRFNTIVTKRKKQEIQQVSTYPSEDSREITQGGFFVFWKRPFCVARWNPPRADYPGRILALLALHAEIHLSKFTSRPSSGKVTSRPNLDEFTPRPSLGKFTSRPSLGKFTSRPNLSKFTSRPSSGKFTSRPNLGVFYIVRRSRSNSN